MRMLNAAEYDSFSGGGDLVYDARQKEDENDKTKTEGGALETVWVIGSRFSFGAGAGRLIPLIGTVVTVANAALWAWDNVIDTLDKEIDAREKEAKYGPNEIEEVVVEGHRQGNVMEDVDGVRTWTGRFWLDCDGDGEWASQYFVDANGVRWLDVTGDGQWHVVPDRSDWRRGFH